MKRAVPLPAARLLKPTEAAAYCGLSRGLFHAECRVRPIIFGRSTERFDRRDLDDWIDRRKDTIQFETEDEILARLDNQPIAKRKVRPLD